MHKSSKPERPEDSLAYLCPELVLEWHNSKNYYSPINYKAFSNKKAWWVCKICQYEWCAVIASRAKGSGCPACSGRVATAENNIQSINPPLAAEWHPKNLKPAQEFAPASNKKVWWLCSKGHEWEAQINSRNAGHGCPICSGRISTTSYNLKTECPDLIKEWHPCNTLPPEVYTPSSKKTVWWLCAKCGHEWKSVISNRTRASGSGCPACRGGAVTKSNNFAVLNPELLREWHSNNSSPEMYRSRSGKKVLWQCENCRHEWEAIIANRSKGHGCPACARRGFSSRIPGYLYVQEVKFQEVWGTQSIIKFGITNNNPYIRLNRQSRESKALHTFICEPYFFQHGIVAARIEQDIIKNFKQQLKAASRIGKTFDGSTETLPFNQLQKLLSFIEFRIAFIVEELDLYPEDELQACS